MPNVDDGAKVLVFGDLHAPYHNHSSFDLLCKVAALWKPDYAICLGDFADMYAATHFVKDPKRRGMIIEELPEVAVCARRITEACGSATTLVECEGNHEDRVDRQVLEKVPFLKGLVPPVQTLIGWDKLGWRHVPYGSYAQIGKVVYTHDIGQSGDNAVQRAAADAQTSIVIGHLHTQQYYVSGSVKGSPRLAFCPGWLGDAARADYMHKLQANRKWVQGFATGRLLADGTTVFAPVPIIRGVCVVEGKTIRL